MLSPQSTKDRFWDTATLSSKVSLTSILSQHASAIFITLLLHLGVFALLLLSWEPEPKNHLSQFDAISEPKPQLTAYFISAKELSVQKAQEANSQMTAEKIDSITKAFDADTPVPKPLVKLAINQTSQSLSDAKSAHKPKLIQKRQQELKPVKKLDGIKDVAKNVSASELLAATQQYLYSQGEASIESMSGSYVRETTHYGASLSEMTPEMPRYQVKIIEDKTQATSSSHRLDPNRRVKIGDTCYKVVNLSTQINPYGEGLGYAEPCDPVSPTKRALDAAISHRLSKMKIR
jgi:hypothetical protein